QIKLMSNYRNDIYHGTVHTANNDNPNGNFRGWKRIMDAEEFEGMNNDSGWIDWETMNNATKRQTDDPGAIQNQYRVITVHGVKKCYLRVNVNNVVTQMAIGSIPKKYVPKAQNFYLRTPVTTNPAVIFVGVDGVIRVYLNTNDVAKWAPSDYLIGETSWIIDDE